MDENNTPTSDGIPEESDSRRSSLDLQANDIQNRFGHGTQPLPILEPSYVPRLTLMPRFTAPLMQDLIDAGAGRRISNTPSTPLPSILYATKPSKQETNQAMGFMGRPTIPKHILKPGEEAFDPIDFATELSSAASPDHSPEPVPIKPQHLTYTTVGSVVNPNAVPQFSAPNRIQREGANRRPLHTLLGTPRYEPMVQSRGAIPTLPSLNMANSMLYAQSIARSPVRATPSPSTTSTSGCSSRPTISNMPGPLGKQEEVALMRNLLSNELQERSGNVADATGSPNISKKHTSSATLPSRGIYTVKDLIDEHNRSNSVPGSVQGLEKMQTLQRLAKFDNPMRELARTRLSEFSVLKSQTDGYTSQEMLLQSQIGMSKTSNPSNATGELDLGYKFPPPGLAHPSTTQSNQSLPRRLSQAAPAPTRPGYPEPLTAGPPGQRQFPSQSSMNYNELWANEYGSQTYNAYGNGTASSPWGNGYSYHPLAQPEFFQAHTGTVKSNLVDTIDPTNAAKYYSSGYPTDMSGYYTPLSEENARLMAEGPAHLLPKAVKDARRDARTTKLIFEGQRRYNQMNAEDYFKELIDLKAYDDAKKQNPYGAIGPPKKKELPPVEPKPITDEEVKNKPIPELVTSALESSWGALAGYRSVNCPGSYNDLSKMVCSPEFLIDAEEEGNKSFFGEDWGKPMKRSAVHASAGWDA
jgi:hypothetical protein